MANYGLYEKPYVKLAGSQDFCYTCFKEKCNNERRNPADIMIEEQGKIADQFVFFIRRSGVDTCICFDCLKKISKDLLPEEVVTEEPIVIDSIEESDTVKEEVTKETAKESKKKDSKANGKK